MQQSFSNMATRQVLAYDKFLSFAQERGASLEDATLAASYYQKKKLVKFCMHSGQFHAKHGAYLDLEAIQQAAKFQAEDQAA